MTDDRCEEWIEQMAPTAHGVILPISHQSSVISHQSYPRSDRLSTGRRVDGVRLEVQAEGRVDTAGDQPRGAVDRHAEPGPTLLGQGPPGGRLVELRGGRQHPDR